MILPLLGATSQPLAKVRASLDVLQFRLNVLGRQLGTERTGLIGIDVPILANPVFAMPFMSGAPIETLREQRIDG